jgi:hypothetical protein
VVIESDAAVEELASIWLAAERQASERGNAGGTEERARAASAAYDEAVARASREDLLVGWHAAQRLQDATEMGSKAWAEARAVSELLRMEYLASEDPAPDSSEG